MKPGSTVLIAGDGHGIGNDLARHYAEAGHTGSVMYGVGKAGMNQMAFSLSHEFPTDNITFNALGLSLYGSPMTNAISKNVLDEVRAGLVKRADMQLDEIAGAIDFFASDAARQITGQTLYFGGVR